MEIEKVTIEIARSKKHAFVIVMRGQTVLHATGADKNDQNAIDQVVVDAMIWAMDNTEYIPGK